MDDKQVLANVARRYEHLFSRMQWFARTKWTALASDEIADAAARSLVVHLQEASNARFVQARKLFNHSFNCKVSSAIVLVLACITYLADQPYNPGMLMVIAGYLQLLSVILHSRGSGHMDAAYAMVEDLFMLERLHMSALADELSTRLCGEQTETQNATT
jgi:hypothetical protein